MYTVDSAVYTLDCAVYTADIAMYSVDSAVYTVDVELYTICTSVKFRNSYYKTAEPSPIPFHATWKIKMHIFSEHNLRNFRRVNR